MAQPRIDPDSFGFLIGDVSRLMRAELDRRTSEAGIGLTPGEGRTLVHAARAGPVRQNVLAESMGIEAMTLSTYLDRLEAQGFVERQPDPADRRAKIVHLTEAAHEAIEKTRLVAAAIRADAWQGMSEEDQERLIALLKTARTNLSACKTGTARKESTAA